MDISLESLIGILESYKYWIIFPIAVVEGPIIIVISGFLVNLNILNGFLAYSILVVGDVLGDTVYYFIGRYWRSSVWIKKLVKFLGYDEKTEIYLEEHFQKHKFKTFLIGKFTHGLGGMIEIASGIAKMNFWEYLGISFVTTLPKAFVLFFLGYYLGTYYERINGYIQTIGFVSVGVAVISLLFIISKKLKKDLLPK